MNGVVVLQLDIDLRLGDLVVIVLESFNFASVYRNHQGIIWISAPSTRWVCM